MVQSTEYICSTVKREIDNVLGNLISARIDRANINSDYRRITDEKLKARDAERRQQLTLEQTQNRAKVSELTSLINQLEQQHQRLTEEARVNGCPFI